MQAKCGIANCLKKINSFIKNNHVFIWKSFDRINTFVPDCFSIHQPLFSSPQLKKCFYAKAESIMGFLFFER